MTLLFCHLHCLVLATMLGGLSPAPAASQDSIRAMRERAHDDTVAYRDDSLNALRAELGSRALGFKPFLFADLGWAGDRARWTTGVRPVSGAGAGASMMDGLFHFDIAKGVHPLRGVQVDAYLDTRF